MQKYKDRVDFLTVYILEAHANDEWPIGSSVCNLSQTTTFQQRVNACQQLINQYNYQIPIVLDGTPDIYPHEKNQNAFEKHYAGWPIRFYILQCDRVMYIAQPIDASFYLNVITEHLDRLLS
jgi:hypothetical protein